MAFSVGDRVSYNGRIGTVTRTNVLAVANRILVEWEDGLSLATVLQISDVVSA